MFYKCLGEKRWAELKGYRRRWISRDGILNIQEEIRGVLHGKDMKNVAKEPVAKVFIYNMLINL